MKRILTLTLALLLIAGLAVNCSDRGSSSMSSDVAAELSNLPSDVRGVAYMNMDKLRNSPMFSSIKDSMNRKWIFLIIAFLFICVAATLGYGYISSDSKSATDVIFTRAEELYSQKKYISALKYYQLFLSQETVDEASQGLAKQRITSIEGKLENQKKIETLLEKALTAFEDNNFLTPEEENATNYTIQILEMDPQNTTALQLRESMKKIKQSTAAPESISS